MRRVTVAAVLLCGLVACGKPATVEATNEPAPVAATEAIEAEPEVPIEKRFRKAPELGSCRLPDRISGAKLVQIEPNGIIELGWFSHCNEGDFVGLPLVQKGLRDQEIFVPESGPAHLDCRRADQAVADAAGLLARYTCTTVAGYFDETRDYDVPKRRPKPE